MQLMNPFEVRLVRIGDGPHTDHVVARVRRV